MENRCFAAEDLDELLDLSTEDPRRLHLESCSNCRTLLKSYKQFLAFDSSHGDSFSKEAGQKLSKFLKEWVAEAEDGAKKARDNRSLLNRMFDWLPGPARVPAIAMVILITGVSAFWTARDNKSAISPSGILRSASTHEAASQFMGEASLLPGDDIHLSWKAVPQADNYRIHLLAGDLRVLKEIDLGIKDQHVINANSLQQESGSQARFWRITATHRGDVVEQSELRALPTHP
jgi:hypothetical protein